MTVLEVSKGRGILQFIAFACMAFLASAHSKRFPIFGSAQQSIICVGNAQSLRDIEYSR
ncbi:hypothetical protein K432DRAFT_383282 [Lepidopterella palustris CBS 459.81]|uniref:Uncharacterized protein n=1 Tax=Lepidopterella palustris CBS 459.81 TaxID=1314670 RepID=A0A8E2JEN2_9PEZI|nr:hypothetical protein K432DRAFT_383282 [Lepidopterella palustris CBS 459.81]